jgi:hypothetical protein
MVFKNALLAVLLRSIIASGNKSYSSLLNYHINSNNISSSTTRVEFLTSFGCIMPLAGKILSLSLSNPSSLLPFSNRDPRLIEGIMIYTNFEPYKLQSPIYPPVAPNAKYFGCV